MTLTNQPASLRADQHQEMRRGSGADTRVLRRLAPLTLATALALVLSLPARAQDAADWTGKRVVPKLRGLTLRVNDEAIESGVKAFMAYVVEEVDGPSLLLKAEGDRTSGWAEATQVVAVDQAVEFFTAQIGAHPRDAFAYAMRGFVHFEKNERDLALRDYDEALRLDPRDLASYCGRGTVWLAKKQYDKAIADFGQALQFDPKNTVAYIGRGKAQAAGNAFTKAIADFSEAIWLDPLSLVAYEHRGNAWQSKHEPAKAIVDYNVVIRLDPEHAPTYLARGAAWAAQRRYDRALADLSDAVRLDPRYALAHRQRAWILATCPDLKLRDAKNAVESASRACQLTNWKDADALDVLAAACASADDFESAVKWQTAALALDTGVSDKAGRQARLELYRDRRPYRHAPP